MKCTETTVTLTIDDDEREVEVRGYVETGSGLGMGGSWGAQIDGGVQLLIDGAWTDIEDVALDASDVELVDEALCDEALSLAGAA